MNLTISTFVTKQRLTALIEEKMRNIFYSILIYCFIFSVISCGKTTEENVNDTVSKTNDTLFGGSGGSTANVVFGKTILDPDATQSKDFEESGSDIIETSSGDYVVVGTSISWEWPSPDNMDDILIVKLDGN